MANSTPSIICITGQKGADTFRLIENVTARLAAQGYRIAALRHDPEPHSGANRPDDAGLFIRAGAVAEGTMAKDGASFFLPRSSEDTTRSVIARHCSNCHLVLVENDPGLGLDMIEVVTPGCGPMPADRGLCALVGDCTASRDIPCFALDDVQGLCAFLEERYLKARLSAAIMAGGRSSRLGRNKALLPLGHSTVIEQVIALVARYCTDVSIITNSPQDYAHLGLAATPDIRPGCGPLSGIHAALSSSPTEYVLAVSCDMPLIKPEHLDLLRSSYPGHDITMFKTERFQPLCAVYRRTCLSALEELIDHGEYRIIDLFPALDVKIVRWADENAFRSINTDEDYEVIRRLFQEK